MVLKVKCALLTRTLDEEKSSVLEREESFVALGAKRHFPGDYSWHLASHKKVLERLDAAEGHSKEHSPSAVKMVGPSNALLYEQPMTMGPYGYSPCSVAALASLRCR